MCQEEMGDCLGLRLGEGINEAVAVVQPRPSGREDGSHPPKTGTQNLDSVKAVGTDSPNLSRHVHPELCLSLGLYASISILTKKKDRELLSFFSTLHLSPESSVDRNCFQELSFPQP